MKINLPERQNISPGGSTRTPPRDPALDQGTYQAMSQLGGQIGSISADMAEKQAQAKRSSLITERIAQAHVESSAYLEERAQNPDGHESLIKDTETFQKQLRTRLNDGLDARTKQMLDLHLQPVLASEAIKSRHLAVRQFVDSTAARNDKALGDLTLAASQAASPDEMMTIIQTGQQSIEDLRATGVLSAVQAQDRSDKFRDGIYTNQIEKDLLGEPGQVLKLLNDPENYKDLRPDLRVRYMARAQHAVEARRAENLEALRAQVKDADYALDRGFVPPNLNTLAAQVKGTKLEPEFAATVASAQQVAQFAVQPPRVQDEMVGQLTANRNRTGQEVKLIERLDKVRDRQRQDFKNDPIQLGVELGLQTPLNPLDLSNRENAIAGLQERNRAALRLEAHFGQPVAPLQRRELEQLQQVIKTGDINTKRTVFGMLHEGLGDRAKLAFAQLAPDDPVSAMAGYEAKKNPVLSNQLLRGQAILHPDKKMDGSPSGGSLIPMPSEKEMRLDFDNITRDAFVGMSDQVRSNMYQAARAVYASRSIDAGDKDTSAINGDRWEEAVMAVTGPIEKYNGKRTILPQGYDKSRFKDEVRRQIKQLEADGLLAEGMTYSRVDDMPLQPFGDGRYVFVSGDSHLGDKNGKRIVIDLNKNYRELPR